MGEGVEDNMGALPDGYKEPITSNYMKLEEGDNSFRILSKIIVGMEYWIASEDGKGRVPVRRKMDEGIEISELEIDPKTGKLDMPKHFWAFVVWNRNAEKIQILEITQATVRKAIAALERNKKWGDLRDYDICVTGEGQGIERRYPAILPEPKEKVEKKILDIYKNTKINLEALFDGDDPFKVEGESEKLADDVAKEV